MTSNIRQRFNKDSKKAEMKVCLNCHKVLPKHRTGKLGRFCNRECWNDYFREMVMGKPREIRGLIPKKECND